MLPLGLPTVSSGSPFRERRTVVSVESWVTEDDEVRKVPPEAEFKMKAYLVLIDSDHHNWGIVEDTMNDILWVPGKGEIVGTWSRPRYDNLIHISLATAISALQDRSIQTFAKYAEERRQIELSAKKPAKRLKKAVELEPTPEPVQELSVDERLRFNSLRARLKGVK